MTTLRHRFWASRETGGMSGTLDALGWGAFFIWIGVAFLANVSLGVGLLGVGIITLSGQLARRAYHLPWEGFWLTVGALFVVGGLWELLQIGLPLVPVLFVLAGVIVLLSAFAGKRPHCG